jgi:hypothetical protein
MALTPQEQPAHRAALRISRTRDKNACLERGALHILRRTCLRQYRLGYPLSTPGII